MNNHWAKMQNNTHRRVANVAYDMFYMVDLQGKYAFHIHTDFAYKNPKTLRLKGMVVQNQNSHLGTDLYIALKNNDEWSIFARLCDDLVETANNEQCTQENLLEVIQNRLEDWREFLLAYKNVEFSLNKQMGLFSELLCLKEIIAKQIGYEKAILHWVGADFHKQDFVFDDEALEVKSYTSSKGAIIEISSVEQLYSEKSKFYLIAYGLSISSNGQTCEDMILYIDRQLQHLPEIKRLFHKKLLKYGYINSTENEKYSFIVDNVMIFSVNEKFPKITPINIASAIQKVKYQLNLLQCEEFRIEEINLQKENL